MYVLHELAALGVFAADVQQSDAWSRHTHHALGVDAAHLGELHQVRRLHVGVGAHVEHQDAFFAKRGDRAESRPFDAVDAVQVHQR